MAEPTKQIKPTDATHLEFDGTYWRNLNGSWSYWRVGWGWCSYIGPVNKAFLNKFREIGA